MKHHCYLNPRTGRILLCLGFRTVAALGLVLTKHEVPVNGFVKESWADSGIFFGFGLFWIYFCTDFFWLSTAHYLSP